MTITESPVIITTKKQDNYRMVAEGDGIIPLPELPYLLLRITRIE